MLLLLTRHHDSQLLSHIIRLCGPLFSRMIDMWCRETSCCSAFTWLHISSMRLTMTTTMIVLIALIVIRHMDTNKCITKE